MELNDSTPSRPADSDEANICIRDIAHISAVGVICSFSLVCNSFSLLVLHRLHDMHDVTKQLLVALTIADVGVGFFGLLASCLCFHNKANDQLGNVSVFFQLLGLCILATMTVVRYIAVSQPLRLETLVTKTRAYISLACAAAICLTVLLCVLVIEELKIHLYIIVLIIVTSLLCVVIVYVKLLLIARRQARRIAAAEINAGDAQAQLHRSNVKSLKTFLIITGTVGLTWLPSFILFVDKFPHVYIVIDSLRFSNSWLNTLIYCWRNGPYRKVAKRLVCRLGQTADNGGQCIR